MFRGTVIELVYRRRRYVTYYDAVYEGAEMVGISPATADRYLRKMISAAGPLTLGKGKRGHQPLLPRDEHYAPGDQSTTQRRQGQTTLPIAKEAPQ